MPIFRRQIEQEPDWEESSSLLRSSGEFVWEVAKVIIISLAIIVPVRYFLIQPFYVKGASMEPNFYDHEYLIINEISYRFQEPARGDIIVFKYPRDPKQYFIKRIVGLPGEKIVVQSNQVWLYNDQYPDGVVLDESIYLAVSTITPGSSSYLLGPDEYFVLGDNRTSSLDSRTFGPVAREFIIGRAWFRGWPFDKIKSFESPEYTF